MCKYIHIIPHHQIINYYYSDCITGGQSPCDPFFVFYSFSLILFHNYLFRCSVALTDDVDAFLG